MSFVNAHFRSASMAPPLFSSLSKCVSDVLSGFSYDARLSQPISVYSAPLTLKVAQKKADAPATFEVVHSTTVADAKLETTVTGGGDVNIKATHAKLLSNMKLTASTDLGSAKIESEYTGISDMAVKVVANLPSAKCEGSITKELGKVAGGPLTVGMEVGGNASNGKLTKLGFGALYGHGGYNLAASLTDKGDTLKVGCATSAYSGTVAAEVVYKMSKTSIVGTAGYATTLATGEKLKTTVDSSGTAACSLGLTSGPSSVTLCSSMGVDFGPPKVGVKIERK